MKVNVSSSINLLLITLIVVGAVFVTRLHSEKNGLETEYASLNSAYGEFTKAESSLPQIIRLKSNDPWEFRWRVYLPAGYSGLVGSSLAYGASSELGHNLPWDHPAEFLITQTFEVESSRRSKAKHIRTHVQCINWVSDQAGPARFTSGQGSGRTVRNSEFLAEHWQELDFESLEPIGESVEIDSEFNLLKIKIPEHLEEEYKKASRPSREGENLVMSLVLTIKDENK